MSNYNDISSVKVMNMKLGNCGIHFNMVHINMVFISYTTLIGSISGSGTIVTNVEGSRIS